MTIFKDLYNAIVELVDDVKTYVFDDNKHIVEEPVKKPPVTRVFHHKDMTPFTQEEYDYVLENYESWQHTDKKYRLSCNEFAEYLNERLGKKKSYRSYYRLWKGEVKREDLKSGVIVDE